MVFIRRLKSPLYDYNICVLKKYNENTFKITRHKVLRRSGIEIDDNFSFPIRGTVNDEKMEQNISRAKSKIREYGLCNEWDFFVTLTIDQSKFDRFDLQTYYKAFSKFLNNYNSRHNIKIKYLFIPERHQNGAWHMHGLISGLPEEHLTVNQYGYYDWIAYRNKFGYISLDFLKDKAKASSYILKYVGKDMGNSVTELNAKLYYCSKGLKTAEVIKKGSISANIEPDFRNEYVEVKHLNSLELALALFD